MKVWLIRLIMGATLVARGAARFSETALSGRPHPGHRPARRYPQGGAVPGEPRPVRRRRLAHDVAERPAERAEAVEADVEADLGHGRVGLAQQLHRALNPTALEVAVRRLAERRPELAAEVRGR